MSMPKENAEIKNGVAGKQNPISGASTHDAITICGESINLDEITIVDVTDFVNGIFHTVPDGAVIVVNGFKKDPKKQTNWKAVGAEGSLPSCINPGNNTYIGTRLIRSTQQSASRSLTP